MATAQTDTNAANQSAGGGQTPSDTVKLIDRLVQQNAQLEKQNKELIDQIQALRQGLVGKTGSTAETPRAQSTAAAKETETENV